MEEMPELSPTAFGSMLSVLRTLPIWVLAGLALAGYAVLFVPAFGGIDSTGFRAQWGVAIWIEALTFSMLTVARALEGAVTSYLLHRKSAEVRRALRMVPRHHQCWWHLAKQQDDSVVSQIALDVEVANLTDRPVRLVKARLIRPRMTGEFLHGDVMLPEAGSPYHSPKHAVPPHDTVTASLHIMVRGAIAAQGSPVRATFGITDQFGDEYRLKGVIIPTRDPRQPKLPLTTRLQKLPGLRHIPKAKLDDALVPPPEWQHHGKFDRADLILNEERRNYAARGRTSGGLGSLNVGLQSEPNYGWTIVGSTPVLLWDRDQAKPIESPNLERVTNLHGLLDGTNKDDLERYLLSHLHKGSRFSDVAYFIFLALHRMGRTVDALRAARLRLAGDKVYGYSNLLGTLSAIVSHEHFEIDPDLYSQILEALAGDTEYNFRLDEKINLARLRQIDETGSIQNL
jgi:hypothetical protein